jgi:hypothetical protein
MKRPREEPEDLPIKRSKLTDMMRPPTNDIQTWRAKWGQLSRRRSYTNSFTHVNQWLNKEERAKQNLHSILLSQSNPEIEQQGSNRLCLLAHLPAELIRQILSYLNLRDSIHFFFTSKGVAKICMGDSIQFEDMMHGFFRIYKCLSLPIVMQESYFRYICACEDTRIQHTLWYVIQLNYRKSAEAYMHMLSNSGRCPSNCLSLLMDFVQIGNLTHAKRLLSLYKSIPSLYAYDSIRTIRKSISMADSSAGGSSDCERCVVRYVIGTEYTKINKKRINIHADHKNCGLILWGLKILGETDDSP